MKFRLLVIAIIFVFSLMQGQGINNGDWGRTAGISAGIIPEPWQALAELYPIQAEQQPQALSIGILATGISYLMRDMGINHFPSALVFFILNMVFAAGMIVLAETFDGLKKTLCTIYILLTYLCFGFYEKSLYEEAIILPLLPWICVGAHLAKTQGRFFIYTIAAIFISIAKVQMFFCAPFFICFLFFNLKASGGARGLFIPLILIAIAPICAAILLSESANKIPNIYNRFYNGVGWSIMNSHAWPGREFGERNKYFYAHRDSILKEIDAKYEGIPYRELLGTAFWPTGEQLLIKLQSEKTPPEERKMAGAVIAQGAINSYALYVINNPRLLVQVMKNTYLMVVKSNYNLEYIQAPPVVNVGIFKLLRDVKKWLCANGGLIFFAAIFSGMVIGFRWPSFLMGLYVLLLPLFVVVGDGFYEFEKHLSPYMILTPAFVFMLIISKNSSAGFAVEK